MLLAILLAASAAPVPPMPPVADWKPAIKTREFKFEDKNAGASAAVEDARKAGITTTYEQDPDGRGYDATFTFQKKDAPKVTIHGHIGTAIILRGDVLYVADFSPNSTGCQIVAYDLNTGKKAWTKSLEGIGPVDHTKYRNRVAMAVEKHPKENHFALVIVGLESFGKYVEVLDLITGKQLAHKKYDEDK